MLMEDCEREKERMRGDGVDAQKLSETDLLVACFIKGSGHIDQLASLSGLHHVQGRSQ